MNLARNIFFLFLLAGFGLTLFQYAPALKKPVLQSELSKKGLPDNGNDAQEKDSDDENEENDGEEYVEKCPRMDLHTFLSGVNHIYRLKAKYCSVKLSNITPPPELL